MATETHKAGGTTPSTPSTPSTSSSPGTGTTATTTSTPSTGTSTPSTEDAGTVVEMAPQVADGKKPAKVTEGPLKGFDELQAWHIEHNYPPQAPATADQPDWFLKGRTIMETPAPPEPVEAGKK
jgi:hypothetical protein